jgi:hypothetical protein
MLPHFREEKIPVPTFTQGRWPTSSRSCTAAKARKPCGPGTSRDGWNGERHAYVIWQECLPVGRLRLVPYGCRRRDEATVGPNLDQSLRGKSAAYIQVSIVKPNAAIAPGIMPMTYGSQLSKQQIVAFLHA